MGVQENRGPEVQIVVWIMYVLALASVLLRVYVRAGLLKAFGADDCLMIIAMVSFTLHTGFCLSGVAHGTGQHAWNLDLADISIALKNWWFCYLWYCTTMIFSKASIAFFLLRITPFRSHRLTIYIALGISVFISTAFFFIAMFQCSPISFFWTRIPGTGSCIDIGIIIDITYVYSAFAILTDFTFTLLPIWLVKDLQVDRRTKYALIPILSLAAVASCAVIVRLAYVQKFREADFLWATTDIAIWSQVEQALAIAAGSLSTLQPLFRMALARLGFKSLSLQSGGIASLGRKPKGSMGSGVKSNGLSSSTRIALQSLNSPSTFTRLGDSDSNLVQEGKWSP
ncbi:hypothetical protein JX265_008745 [Neoarthrinium moseri]|uniref:Rhodopsin domain-containing protein n=1 Tax=Neoarthrinium moseri TaxID=1658444 RepID=A0A9P9WGW9_9PEZI|nr:uncharacterized protein JN550_008779 [Neoarthrinium moseri]KAI1863528.1 hypothetical protein JX265_008745 [Neoarthrinium moseri]KAI1864492.1 hypothetical protein JN550_008779 [Neoarthrinium moseri]